MHRIAEHRRALLSRVGRLQHLHEILPEEDVVAQDQHAGLAADKVLTQQIGLGQTARRGLDHVFKPHAEARAVAQQAHKPGLILGGGDDQDLAHAGQEQHRQRIIDHRLVVDRQELLGDCDGQRMQARACPPRQNDTLSRGLGRHAVTRPRRSDWKPRSRMRSTQL